MKVWIQNEIGFLQGYSIIPQETMTEVEADREPTDFTNWRYDGVRVIHDPDHAPEPDPIPPSDLDMLKQQNAVLAKQLATSLQTQGQVQKMLAEVMIEVAALKNGGTTNE